VIYPQNFEHKIGFDKIRQMLTERCLSGLGEERVADMAFSTDYDLIDAELHQTDEFMQIIRGEEEFPDNYFFDVRRGLKRIRVEGTYLDEGDLFDLRRSLDTIRAIVRFLNPADPDEEIRYPYLQRLSADVAVFPRLIERIDQILDKFGRVRDPASPRCVASCLPR
jgi:DNA mismatch repair protein MutS2